ncbi:hypothetical protein I547_7446 [Mycobacterium kansasii 824]|nr:hypothetical protein I547_7446 [Mycobacterium kansasii 824]
MDAPVAAGLQRGGSYIRAQRYGGPAQASAGNHFQVEPIEDRHHADSSLLAPSISAIKTCSSTA